MSPITVEASELSALELTKKSSPHYPSLCSPHCDLLGLGSELAGRTDLVKPNLIMISFT